MLISVYTTVPLVLMLFEIPGGLFYNQQNLDHDRVSDTKFDYTPEETNFGHPESHPIERQKRWITGREGAYWPKGIIPYIFVDMKGKAEYLRVMAMFEDNTCIRFVPYNKTLGHLGHLNFRTGSGCVTKLGYYRWTEGQSIYCCGGTNCVHELGHAMGMYHEQNNPMRDGWIRSNPKNIWPSNVGIFSKYVPGGFKSNIPYDLSTVMNYQSWIYSSGGPTLTVLFPELKMTLEYYYMTKELSEAYKCPGLPPCNGRKLTCVNDGFQSSVHGKCTCNCPTGLDPNTGCSTPQKKIISTWPKGQYALPKPKTGCPDKSFKDGQLIHYGEGRNVVSKPYHMMGEINGAKAEQDFCTRTEKDDVFANEDEEKFNWPVGSYCIYRKSGSCPAGFYPGYVQYDDMPPKDAQHNSHSGELPDGVYGNDTLIEFCCQYKGFTKDPAVFPTEKPFALYQYGKTCQQVAGMHVEKEYFGFDNHNAGGKLKVEGKFHHYTNKRLKILYLYLCYYTPADTDCGSGTVLNKTNPETTIEINSAGRTDMDCTWVVRGEHGHGTLVLDVEGMKIRKKDGKSCLDKVEVRHARIGAEGLVYCGDKLGHSIRSITNKMLVRFMTFGSSDSFFKAIIRWVPNDELCYNAEARGVTYNGKTNYTRMFDPCLLWSQATECQHHPFKEGDEFDNLEGNFCRNPDNSFRPWCYTKIKACERNYCDVCKLETPNDQIDYCKKLKDEGFCTRDAAKAVKYCALTCHDLLPSTGPMMTYSKIECDPPTPSSDGDLIGNIKNKYSLGDKVEFKYKKGSCTVSSTCMTDGNWSPVGYSCLGLSSVPYQSLFVSCTSTECPLNNVLFNGLCYGLIEQGKTFTLTDALIECKKRSGFLPIPKSFKESEIIHTVSNGHSIWLPAKYNKVEGTWVSEDGSKLDWNNLNGIELKDMGHSEDCVVMKENGRWNDYPCQSKSSVVCAIPKQDNFDSKDLLGSQCTRLLKDRPTMCQDFPEYAKEFCAWTCGVNPVQSISCPVEQSNSDVFVSTKSITIPVGHFVRYSCPKFKYRIKGDEVRACQPSGVLNGEELQCGDCPQDYKMVNNTCYGFIEGRTFSFKEAREECLKVHGFVASPKDEAENNMISSVGLGQPIWLGATDIEKENDFVWEDYSQVDWLNWADGEPKKSGSSLDCAMMNHNKQWNNVHCNEQFGAVCIIQETGTNECYDPYDKGATYNGKVNYTDSFKPCLPWTEVTECPVHPFKNSDVRHNLEENYCRNPDKSGHPWCYTNKKGCEKSSCNVCNSALRADKADDCQKQRTDGLCTKDVAKAIKECAATCKDLLPSAGPIKNFIEIKCNTPTPPMDGEIVGWTKLKYDLGETVTLKCKRNLFVIDITCLTSGDWSPAGLVCTECPLGYELFNEKCFKFIDKMVTYPQAQEECRKIGGHLPMPKSRDENDFISTLMQGEHIWLGAKDKQGTLLWNDGTELEWTYWDEKPKKKNYCLGMRPTRKWDDFFCDFTWPKMKVVCAVSKLDSVTCGDFLNHQCPKLLNNRPTMCVDFKDFSKKFCAKTCGFCGSGVGCTVQHDDPKVSVSPTDDSIPVGGFVRYACKDNNDYPYQGHALRACQTSGLLTGTPLRCRDISSHIVKVGAASLIKGDKVIPKIVAFTGENEQMRIKNDGKIVAWDFYSQSSIETSFQVWRIVEKNVYRLIGQNVLTTGNNAEQRYEVPKDQQIEVKKGDLIGIWNSAEGGVHFKVCDNDKWRVSWGRKISSSSSFHVGADMNFESGIGCCMFSFQAEVAVIGNYDLHLYPDLKTLPQSKDEKAEFVKVGSSDLSKQTKVMPPKKVFTGDNSQMTIKNDGLIVAWEFYSNSPLETSFQVWRPIEVGKNYSLVGQNVYTTGDDKEQHYDVPKDEQISVKKGDLIGIWNSGKGGVHFTNCDGSKHPTWTGVIFTREILSTFAFTVGQVEEFKSDPTCILFPLRAVVDIL